MSVQNAPPSRLPKVCFVCPYCYPLFNPAFRTMFGGWEVRISQIVKELAHRDQFQVCLVVADVDQPHIEYRDGVELVSWRGRRFVEVPKDDPVSYEEIPPGETTVYRPDLQSESDLEAKSEIPPTSPPGWIKNLYKSIVPWRVRTLIRGLMNGLTAGARLAWRNIADAAHIVRSAVGVIGDIPVFPEMVSIFAEVDADIYIVPGNNAISASVAWFCKNHGRAFVMLAGSDMDFNPRILAQPDGFSHYGDSYRLLLYTIQNAAAHIVQNESQVRFSSAFGVTPVLIPNPIDMQRKVERSEEPSSILWVGNTNERIKQPLVMVDIIRRLPQYRFIMIVTRVLEEDFARLQMRSADLNNLEILSNVPYGEMELYFAQAKLFVNTSLIEGFPNTFLQAGKFGVPVLSLNVDPNGIFSKHEGGLCSAGDVEDLVRNIERLMQDTQLYNQLSKNISHYVLSNHDQNQIIPQYEDLFLKLLNPSWTPAALVDEKDLEHSINSLLDLRIGYYN